jgi:hypothetical protein
MRSNNITQKIDFVLALITSHLEINPSIGGRPPKLKNIIKVPAIHRVLLEIILRFLIALRLEYQRPIKMQMEIKI